MLELNSSVDHPASRYTYNQQQDFPHIVHKLKSYWVKHLLSYVSKLSFVLPIVLTRFKAQSIARWENCICINAPFFTRYPKVAVHSCFRRIGIMQLIQQIKAFIIYTCEIKKSIDFIVLTIQKLVESITWSILLFVIIWHQDGL